MLEARLTIEAPELAAAIGKLAQAIVLGHTGAPSVHASQSEPAQAAAAAPTAHTAPAPASATAAPAATAAQAPAPGPQVTHLGNAPTVAPVAAAPTYTMEQIGKAGADLATQTPGKMPELLALLQKYGVRAITELRPEQLGAFATELRGLGARL